MRGQVSAIGVNRLALTEDGQKIQQCLKSNREFPITEQLMKQVGNADNNTKFDIVVHFRDTDEAATYLKSIAPRHRDIQCSWISNTGLNSLGSMADSIDQDVVIGLKIEGCTVGKLYSYITNPKNSSIARIDLVSGEWSLQRANMPPFRSSKTTS